MQAASMFHHGRITCHPAIKNDPSAILGSGPGQITGTTEPDDLDGANALAHREDELRDLIAAVRA
jgi:hypothetical protein